MNESKGKFLVQLISSLTHKQILFIVWAAIVGLFVWLMLAYQKKMSRRNFRDEKTPPRGTNLVLLKKDEAEKKDVAVKD